LRFRGHYHKTIDSEFDMIKTGILKFAICNLQFAIFFGTFLCPSLVLAHGMDVFAKVEGKTIQGKANFHGGSPAANADVRAFDPVGNEIGRTKTDDQGKFSLDARFRCDYRLLVDTNDGHGGEYTIPAKFLPADLSARGDTVPAADQERTVSEAAPEHTQDSPLIKEIHADVDDLQTQFDRHKYGIRALQDQLDRYEKTIRFRDILGGIGFIVGLTGAAYGFYYRGLLRQNRQSRQ
jgi:nickel transport protein